MLDAPPTPAPLSPRSYNSIMKVTFVATAISIIRYMRFDKVVKQTYDKEQVRCEALGPGSVRGTLQLLLPICLLARCRRLCLISAAEGVLFGC